MDSILFDLRSGVRSLIKRPVFAVIAILTLTLGIGANTAIFSVVNSVLIESLPFPDADRLVHAAWDFGGGSTNFGQAVSPTKFLFYRDQSKSFDVTAIHDLFSSGFNLTGGGEPQRVHGMHVSSDFFRVLGVSPVTGRAFEPADGVVGAPPVAILSDGLWRSYFAGDRSLVGKQIQINGESHTVVGIMPGGFLYDPAADLWTALQPVANPRATGNSYTMIARLKTGITMVAAQREMELVSVQLRSAYPAIVEPEERGIVLGGFRDWVLQDVQTRLYILTGSAGLLLLIACLNFTNLLLARAAARSGEMAIRTALGAGQRQLLRQLLSENLVVAVIGGLFGFLVAYTAVPAIVAMSPNSLPRAAEIAVDWRAAAFAFVLSILSAVVFGLLPALRTSHSNIIDVLKGSTGRHGTDAGGARFGRAMVVAEVAFSMMLLVGSALLIQSFAKLVAVDLGFKPENLTTIQLSLSAAKYRVTSEVSSLSRQLLDRIREQPGVAAAAVVSNLPTENGYNIGMSVLGRRERVNTVIWYRAITSDYFRAIDVPIVMGRGVEPGDAENSAPVAVINQTLARQFWRDVNPVGDLISIGGGKPLEIVGVVADIREFGLDRPARATVFVPQPQVPNGLTAGMNRAFMMSIVVRSSTAISTAIDMTTIRGIVQSIDPAQPVANVRPMTDVLGATLAPRRFVTVLLGVFAGLALLLAVVGLYGVLAYQVNRRSYEIGVRIALGATPAGVFGMVVGQGMTLTSIGLLIGGFGAALLSRSLESFLFEVSARDPLMFIAAAVSLAITAALACAVPAVRAMRVDPLVAQKRAG